MSTTSKTLTISLSSLIYCFIVEWTTLNWALGCHFGTSVVFLSLFFTSCSSIHLFKLSLFILEYILLSFRNIDQNIKIPFFMHDQWPLFTIHRNRRTSNTWMWKWHHNVMFKWCICRGMRSFTARNRLPSVNLPISILWQIYCFSIEISAENSFRIHWRNKKKRERNWMRKRRKKKTNETEWKNTCPTHPCHLTSTLFK